ncbi:MAG TPA: hypothetical protein VLM79_15400 [Kofleriaceae bacterium]|nr:hypothetical protein [Kofleriaceae bacterium]
MLAACGGGGDDDDGTVTPEGTHHQYVVSKATVFPAGSTSPASPGFGLDVGGKTSSMLDGRIDNNLGKALQILAGVDDALNGQATLDAAVSLGTVILLVDFQSKDFVNSNAGFAIKFGANPNPPACTDANDMTCGHHLMGGASFQLATNSPTQAVTGKLAAGTFDGGPGNLSLQITIGSTTPILLPLVQARVKVTSASDTSLKALIGGMITEADLKTNVGGALETAVTALVGGACTQTNPPNPPTCGCTGLAATVMGLLDGDTGAARDCKISADEILANPATASDTKPDVCSMDSCAAPDAISIGINIEAVAATFP